MPVYISSGRDDGDHLVTKEELRPLVESDTSFHQRYGLWLAQSHALETASLTLHERAVATLFQSGTQSLLGVAGGGQSRFLYVMQGEWAVAIPGEGVVGYLGTDDATTCHIIGIRNPVTGAIALMHVDQLEALQQIQEVEEAVSQHTGQDTVLELYLVGGYNDPAAKAESMSRDLFRYFCLSSDKSYKLMVACLAPVNTVVTTAGVHAPRCRSLGFRCADGIYFSGDFPPALRHPAKVLRSARGMSGNVERPLSLLDYNAQDGPMLVHPFYWSKNNRSIPWLLSLDDEEFLRYTSTSPLVEGPFFVIEMRKVFSLLLTDDGTTVFKGNQPLRFALPIVNPEELVQAKGQSISESADL